MKISVWNKYHLIKWISFVCIFAIGVILGIYVSNLISLIVFILGSLCTAIILHSIKCPKCGKSIDNYTTLLSGPDDGWFSPMSKTCKRCGCDFTSSI